MVISKPSRDWLLAQVVSTDVLTVVLVFNFVLLLYRFVVIIDAYRLARGPAERRAHAPARRTGAPRSSRSGCWGCWRCWW